MEDLDRYTTNLKNLLEKDFGDIWVGWLKLF